MSVLVEFSMRPMGKGEGFGEDVARVVRVVEESGVEYRTHAMGTLVEGTWDDCFGVIRACYQELSRDTKRVNIDIRVDAREGQENRIEQKVARVEEEIGHTVSR